ncbi:1-pyrroline-5-carboxylate dehydrogenase 1 [bacterium BMS3Abin02]|nr:1-pyrroline-5-carboxylate dehydrogenase 1 [bacterium BMS3Abin02]GBE22841.1 1-pyrroline-5-carboxylate dehydrogenase 1 [bacterium BMS3Bbin01]
MFEPYVNEPYSDFSDPDNAAAYRDALGSVRSRFTHHPLVIGGKKVVTDRQIESLNPARPTEIIGTVSMADAEAAERALAAAWDAYATWSRLGADERARHLVKLAAILRDRKYELSAWETLEASKNWLEAEADVAEAIDFCEYYARQSVELSKPLPVFSYPGEDNESHLIPIGAGVVIPPWNFPLAILVGMAAGPVAAGNTVVVKPASTTPVVAAMFMQAVEDAGFPPGVINFLPGAGSEVGDVLVDHPKTRFINFTGSMEVGLRIAERAAVVHEAQLWLKRAYMEMGGKDALVVDETADVDSAAAAAVVSAYGFQGQKCSALSRLIVVDDVYDAVLDRVVEAAAALPVGPAEDNVRVNAVISAVQQRNILADIDRGRSEAKLLTGGDRVDLDDGYYIQPTVFADVAPDAYIAQHEIFGPVLSVLRARDFDHAVEIFNGTQYGLTGGLFSARRDRIERARREFHVGNLYINRKITGALVGVQPFGGFNMSGSNAKAGGPDYLRLFMEMKTVAERWLV